MDDNLLHRALMNKEAYPEETAAIHFVETHASRLYLTDRHVYKIKKPVDFGFLDFSTLDKRRHFCEEEVRLNRRFSPATYLGVVPLCRSGSALRFGGPGDTIEYAVLMKRLPEDRMLDRLVAAGAAGLAKEMERLALFIAEMHRRTPPHAELEESSDLQVIRQNWRENFDQTRPFAGKTIPREGLEAARRLVEGFLDSQAPLLRQREKEGFVRELHGDLHSEHICLTDPIQIYDCIEFNRRFRISDVLADIAFLLMDLEFRDRRDLARALLKNYRRHFAWGHGADLLIPFYKAYRAWVRGKVASLAMAQHRQAEEQYGLLQNRGRRYFNLAMGYLAPQALVLTCGLMGVGKSLFAGELAAATGMTHLRSDAERKELAGLDPNTKIRNNFGEGLYAPTMSDATYRSLHDKAGRALIRGNSVVVDASFAKNRHREIFSQLGEQYGVPVLLAHLQCGQATLMERLRQRESRGNDISDGRRELLSFQAGYFDSTSEFPGVIEIDSEKEIDYNVGLTLSRLLVKKTGGR
ncbi:MAG: AAA family ATPase [Desulfuromonadaceae bacterium]|nr:AAA family ATPase [Desulfuromonadaceae bacterium]